MVVAERLVPLDVHIVVHAIGERRRDREDRW